MKYSISKTVCKDSREWAFKACPFCGEGEDEVRVMHVVIEPDEYGCSSIKEVQEYAEEVDRDFFLETECAQGGYYYEGLAVECAVCGTHTLAEAYDEADRKYRNDERWFRRAEETGVERWNKGEAA